MTETNVLGTLPVAPFKYLFWSLGALQVRIKSEVSVFLMSQGPSDSAMGTIIRYLKYQ